MDLNKLNTLNVGELLNTEEKNQLADMFNGNGLSDWLLDSVSGQIKLNVKFVNRSTNPAPIYQKDGDSGFDFTANLAEGDTRILEPGQRMLIPTGLYIQVPIGFELQVRSRSGLALKNGIMVLNSPGTVDAGYRGEVGVILYNSDKTSSFTINNGDRIAQGVIAPVQIKHTTAFTEVAHLDTSERGIGGFGSTGV